MRLSRLLFVALLSAALSSAQDQKFALRVDVAVVSVDVEVSDGDGRAVTTLSKEDFLLNEDGTPQEIRHFASTEAPYTTLAMFDCTGSLSDQWQFLHDAMLGFAQGLRSQDSIGMVAFGTDLIPLQTWAPRGSLQLDFQMPYPVQNPVCNDTDFYGAIISAAEMLQQVSTSRKGVVVFTDGVHERIARRTTRVAGMNLPRFVDAAEDREFQAVLRAVRASGGRFYFVAMNTDLNPGTVNEVLHPVADYSPLPLYNMQQVRSRLEVLARSSGGRIVFPRTPSDYAPLYESIARELGSTYSLGYAPPNGLDDGSYHRIEVRVTDPRLKISQSREGYGGPH